jgi:hypothetical protein
MAHHVLPSIRNIIAPRISALRNSASVFHTLGVQIPYGCRQGLCGAFAMSGASRLGFQQVAHTSKTSAGMPGINLCKLS